MPGREKIRFAICSLLLIAAGCTSHTAPPVVPPLTSPQTRTSDDQDTPETWRQLTQSLGGQQISSPDSFAVIVPRTDLDLESEMGQVPISAGIASKFYFYRCSCGKVKVLGEFIVCDYETGDVLDAVRAGQFDVVSVAPILQDTKPAMVSIRFQAEGDGDDLVKAIREALNHTGKFSGQRGG
ncbi:MAG TPA: DUF1259 domain-containing protein [Tepidisphaeraceae bacterium]|jgi:hypothetical protein